MKLNITLPPQVTAALRALGRYKIVLVFVIVAAIYGFLVMQINNTLNVEPNPEEVVAVKKRSPRIDPEVVQQLKDLQDNSVSVQTLFNEARTNPFEQ